MDCVSCHRSIDAEAKLCPYCGADPHTGEKFDTTPLMEATFTRRRDLPAHESVLELFRRRQSLVVAAILIGAVLVVLGLHHWADVRNRTAVNDVPAVPLTEVADLSNQRSAESQLPLPNLDFAWDGNARTMRTYMLEPGAIPPPVAAPVPGTVTPPPSSSAVAPLISPPGVSFPGILSPR